VLRQKFTLPSLVGEGQKSKLPWNAVKRSWRQPAVKTCDDVYDWQGVSAEDFDGADDGESTTILQASCREFAATRKKSSYPSDRQTTLKRDWASLKPTVWEYIVTLLLPLIWQRVCCCVYYFLGYFGDVIQLYNLDLTSLFTAIKVKVCDSSYYCGLCESVISLDIFLYSMVVIAFFFSSFFLILLNVNICKII